MAPNNGTLARMLVVKRTSQAPTLDRCSRNVEETDPSLSKSPSMREWRLGTFISRWFQCISPGIGFDETGLVFELSQAEVNTFTEPILANFIAGTGKNISYGITNPHGQFYIPLFTSSQTVGFGAAFKTFEKPSADDTAAEPVPDGFTCYNKAVPKSVQYERWFTVGEGDVGSISTLHHGVWRRRNPQWLC